MVWFVLSEPCLQLEMLLIRSPHSFTYASLHTVAEAVRLTASTRNPWREKCGGSQMTRRGVSIGSSREHTQHREGPIDRGRFDSSCTCQGVVGGTTATEGRTAPPTPRRPAPFPEADGTRLISVVESRLVRADGTHFGIPRWWHANFHAYRWPAVGFEVVSRSSFEEGLHQRLLFPFRRQSLLRFDSKLMQQSSR